MIRILIFLLYVSLSKGAINLEFQVDGNTTDSAIEVDVKYEPAQVHNSIDEAWTTTSTTSSYFYASWTNSGGYPWGTSHDAYRSTMPTQFPIPTTAPDDAMTSSSVTLEYTSASETAMSAPVGSAAQAMQTHTVLVGARGDLIFSPNSINASVGDVVQFTFFSKNHTLTQSTLSRPCEASQGFDTGFTHFNPTNQTGNELFFLIQNSDPQWFFCRQSVPSSHCTAGMVFAINPGANFANFISNAEHRNSSASTMIKGSISTSLPLPLPQITSMSNWSAPSSLTSNSSLATSAISRNQRIPPSQVASKARRRTQVNWATAVLAISIAGRLAKALL